MSESYWQFVARNYLKNPQVWTVIWYALYFIIGASIGYHLSGSAIVAVAFGVGAEVVIPLGFIATAILVKKVMGVVR